MFLSFTKFIPAEDIFYGSVCYCKNHNSGVKPKYSGWGHHNIIFKLSDWTIIPVVAFDWLSCYLYLRTFGLTVLTPDYGSCSKLLKNRYSVHSWLQYTRSEYTKNVYTYEQL